MGGGGPATVMSFMKCRRNRIMRVCSSVAEIHQNPCHHHHHPPPLHQHGEKKTQEDGLNKQTHVIKPNCLQLQDAYKHTESQLHVHAHTLPI